MHGTMSLKLIEIKLPALAYF